MLMLQEEMRAGQAASMRTEPHPSFQNVMSGTLAANKGHFMAPAQLAELAEAQIAAQVPVLGHALLLSCTVKCVFKRILFFCLWAGRQGFQDRVPSSQDSCRMRNMVSSGLLLRCIQLCFR